jgi:hypothetical protein
MLTPFQAGRARGQHVVQTQYEPDTRTPEDLAQFISSELDGLYAVDEEEKSPRSREQLQISRDYHWGILQGLKDSQ